MRPAQAAAPLAAARRLQHPTMGRSPRFVCRGRPVRLQQAIIVAQPQRLPLEVLQVGSRARYAHRPPAAPPLVCTRSLAVPATLPSLSPCCIAPHSDQLEDPGEVDMMVGRGELRRAVEHEVHRVQRLEHRIQRRAATLPAGLRRLLAGAVAVSRWGKGRGRGEVWAAH